MDKVHTGLEPNNYCLTSVPRLFDKACRQHADQVAIVWGESGDHARASTLFYDVY